jgi:hypothetical protein
MEPREPVLEDPAVQIPSHRPVHHPAPEAVAILESILPHSLHRLIAALEKTVKRCRLGPPGPIDVALHARGDRQDTCRKDARLLKGAGLTAPATEGDLPADHRAVSHAHGDEQFGMAGVARKARPKIITRRSLSM